MKLIFQDWKIPRQEYFLTENCVMEDCKKNKICMKENFMKEKLMRVFAMHDRKFYDRKVGELLMSDSRGRSMTHVKFPRQTMWFITHFY